MCKVALVFCKGGLLLIGPPAGIFSKQMKTMGGVNLS
jgi:hypothetical protein